MATEIRYKVFMAFNEIDSINDMKEVKILYAGEFDHGLYGKMSISEDDLESAVNNFTDGVAAQLSEDNEYELPFNYQHASYEASAEAAKASGWIRRLVKRGKDLFARVQWTEKAKEYIKNKEYKYISAEFSKEYKDENGKKHGFTVLGAALTNVNFLKKGMLPVTLNEADNHTVIELQTREVRTMNLIDELKTTLNLEEADEQAIVEKVKEVVEQNAELEKAKQELDEEIATIKEENENLKAEEEIEIAVEDEDPEEIVEDVELMEVRSKVNELMEINQKLVAKLALADAEKFIDASIAEGKLLPKQRQEWIELHMANSVQTEKLVTNMSKVIEFKESGTDANETENKYADVTVELAEKAKELMVKDNISLRDAQNKVLKTDKDLAERYKQHYEKN